MTVTTLRFFHPGSHAPVEINIPENTSPHLQQTLESLDANHDGVITCSFEAQQASELSLNSLNDQNLNRVSRAFWGFAGPNATNNRAHDYDPAYLHQREAITVQLGFAVYQSIVTPLLNQRTNPNRWQQALNALKLVAYTDGIARLAATACQEAATLTSPTEKRALLDFAENAYFNYLRFGSQVPRHYLAVSGISDATSWRRRDWEQLNHQLDEWDDREFAVDAERPYILAGPGSPITANWDTLQSGGEVMIEVAVPNTFLDNYPSQTAKERAVLSYLNNIARPQFGNILLHANSAQIDREGSQDDLINRDGSIHTDQGNLTRNLFENKPMTYFRVGLQRSGPIEWSSEWSRRRERFDFSIRRDPRLVNGDIRPTRVLPGSFVLQDVREGPSHTAIASDTHVALRDLFLIPETNTRISQGGDSALFREAIDGNHEDPTGTQQVLNRLYHSVTDRVLAVIEHWNTLYDRGEIDRVVITGDYIDFMNATESTLVLQPYRETNVRVFLWLFSHLRAPLEITIGNHEEHIDFFPPSVECRSLRRSPGFCDFYGPYYDDYHSIQPHLFAGVRALIPRSVPNDIFSTPATLGVMLFQAYRESPFENHHEDDGMRYSLRYLVPNETRTITVGDTRFIMAKSGPEDFSYLPFTYQRVPDPVLGNSMSALTQYISGRQVNGRGFSPQDFLSMIYEIEYAQSQGQRAAAFFHYPVLAPGNGPDRTPYNADALSDTVSRAVRLITWYFRTPENRPVVPEVITGHIHTYTETDFALMLTPAEETSLRRDISLILQGIDPTLSEQEIAERLSAIDPQTAALNRDRGYFPITDTDFAEHIYDHFDTLWNRHSLRHHMVIRNVDYPGNEGVPTKLMQITHATPIENQPVGSLFVTQSPLGPDSELGNGTLTLTTAPQTEPTYSATYVRVGPYQNVITAPGNQLFSFLTDDGRDLHDWDTNFRFKPSPAPNPNDRLNIWDGRTATHQMGFSSLPSICQYPIASLCFDAYLRPEYNLINGGWSLSMGTRVDLSINNRAHPVFTLRPNYLFLDLGGNPIDETFNVSMGANHGLLTWQVGARFNPFQGRALAEAALSTDHQFPLFFRALPDIYLAGTYDVFHHAWSALFGIQWRFTLGQIRPSHNGNLPHE